MLNQGHMISCHWSTPACKLPSYPPCPELKERPVEMASPWTNVSYLPPSPILSPSFSPCRSYPSVHLLLEHKALFVEWENHRTHMLWRRGSEWLQIGLGWFTADQQGTGKETGVGQRLAEDITLVTGSKLTSDLNMENGKTEPEAMTEGGWDGQVCFGRWWLKMN